MFLNICSGFVECCFGFKCLSEEQRQSQVRGLVDRKLIKAPSVILLLAFPRWLFCFSSFVVLDVVCCYLSLFKLCINIKIGKIDVNLKLAGTTYMGIAVHLAVAGDVFDGVFLCCPFSHEIS